MPGFVLHRGYLFTLLGHTNRFGHDLVADGHLCCKRGSDETRDLQRLFKLLADRGHVTLQTVVGRSKETESNLGGHSV